MSRVTALVAPETAVPGWGPDLEELARSARAAHVAVSPPSGPHTTPVAVTWAAGRLWFVTPRRSVKARAAVNGPVAALLRTDDATLLLRGTARVLDPLHPGRALRAAGTRLLPASARYLFTQAGETAAITRDAVSALLRDFDAGPLAPRAAVALDPVSAVLLGPGQAGQAVLTIETTQGPLPLPVDEEAGRDRLRLSPAAALLVPGGGVPVRACLTVLTQDEPGLRGKAGMLTRGTATFSRDRRTATLCVERVTWWRGTRTGTLRPADTAGTSDRHAR